MGLVIEVVDRTQKVRERQRFSGVRVSIGRAYDNDMVLTEPHVSPQHAVLEKLESGEWVIYDCGSRNGVFAARRRRVQGRLVVRSGDVYTLGRLQIRVMLPEHPVEEALPLHRVDTLIAGAGRPLVAVLAVLCLLMLIGLQQYFSMFTEWEFKLFAAMLMGAMLGILGWVSIWGLVGRLVKHDARFLAQVTVTAVYLCVELCYQNAVEVLSYGFSSTIWSVLGVALGGWWLLTILLWLNLYMSTNFDRRQRLGWSAGVALLLVGGWTFLSLYEDGRFSAMPKYEARILPPMFYLGQPVSVQQFLSEGEAEIFKPLKP